MKDEECWLLEKMGVIGSVFFLIIISLFIFYLFIYFLGLKLPWSPFFISFTPLLSSKNKK